MVYLATFILLYIFFFSHDTSRKSYIMDPRNVSFILFKLGRLKITEKRKSESQMILTRNNQLEKNFIFFLIFHFLGGSIENRDLEAIVYNFQKKVVNHFLTSLTAGHSIQI